jgi:hypothetical protein
MRSGEAKPILHSQTDLLAGVSSLMLSTKLINQKESEFRKGREEQRFALYGNSGALSIFPLSPTSNV